MLEEIEVEGVERDGLTYYVMAINEFSNDRFIAAGHVEGDPPDTIYLEFGEKEGGRIIRMRKDEALTVIWVLSGAVMHKLVEEMEDDKEAN